MKEIVNGKLYNTETATLLASNRYWDGHNYERSGRNTFLYKTKKGNFFTHHTTLWQGEFDSIVDVSEDEAMILYEQLKKKEVEYQEAFGIEPEEA